MSQVLPHQQKTLDLSQLVPPEIGVHILNQLLPMETRQILSKLQTEPQLCRQVQSTVVGWLYARLYGNFLVVYINNSASDSEDGIPQDCDLAATPMEILTLCRDEMFLATAPKKLAFLISRDMREHTLFQKSLSSFVEMISAPWAGKYFGAIPEVDFHLNGESTLDLPPTLMLVAILNVLVNMTKLSHCNIRSFSIERTHIGQMFPHKWEGVFSHFPSVTHLSLEKNAILLATANSPGLSLGTNTKWPAGLKSLSLSGNDIPVVSAAYLSEFPQSLIKLDLSDNKIFSFGGPNTFDFTLAKELPNLQELDLSENPFLNYMDSRILQGPRKSRLIIKLKGCKISNQCLRDLEVQSRLSKVVLLV